MFAGHLTYHLRAQVVRIQSQAWLTLPPCSPVKPVPGGFVSIALVEQ